MEEILASIRRIISEDEAPAETAAAAPAPEPEIASEPEPAPAYAPEPEPEPITPAFAEAPAEEAIAAEDDVLELTDRYEAPSESIGDLDVMDPADAPFPAAPHPTPPGCARSWRPSRPPSTCWVKGRCSFRIWSR